MRLFLTTILAAYKPVSYECEDCGETLDTLTRLRLHDRSTARVDNEMPGLDITTTETQTADRGGEVEGIDELLEDAQRGEFDALHQAIVRYERTLDAALDADDGGSRHHEVFWAYYEPLVNMLDRATQTEGWAFLHDVVHAHHPQADNDLPLAAPLIENAVGRFLIRTRFTDGVEEIPVDGLEYLVAIPAYATQRADIAREESHIYAWESDILTTQSWIGCASGLRTTRSG
jgi:hypothetical protein